MLLFVQLVGVKRWSWWSKLLSKHPRISLIVPSMPVSGRTSEPRGQWRWDPAQKSTLHSSIAPQVGDDDHDDNLPENFFISPKFLVSVIIKVFLLCKHRLVIMRTIVMVTMSVTKRRHLQQLVRGSRSVPKETKRRRICSTLRVRCPLCSCFEASTASYHHQHPHHYDNHRHHPYQMVVVGVECRRKRRRDN